MQRHELLVQRADSKLAFDAVTRCAKSSAVEALTVSPSYAKEITMDPEKGVELEALFKMGNCTGPRPMRKRRFHGEVVADALQES